MNEPGADEGGGRPRRGRLVGRLCVGAIVVLVLYVLVTFVQVWMADGRDDAGRADAAIVLGAAQYDGRPSEVFRARLDHAASLYRAQRVASVVVTGEGREGDRFTEAYAGLKYLIGVGVPAERVIVVDDGSSTWESLAASVRVVRREGIDDVLLVSDPYHSLRLLGIAEEVGLKAGVSPGERTDSTLGELLRETGAVAVGRVIGYRRLVNLVE